MPRITRDEAYVQYIAKLLEDDWTTLFDPNEHELANISTGTLAIPEHSATIIRASLMA